VTARTLPLVQQGDEPFACVTDPRLFARHLLSSGLKVEGPHGKLYCLLIPLRHDRLQEVLRAFVEKWRPREFLATAVDPANAEVKSLVIQRIRSGFICQAIARVVRPSNAKRGRRAGT
jgi:hypothetical protein